MKPYFLSALLLLAALPTSAQETPEAPAGQPAYNAQQRAFLNLPKEDRDKYITHMMEARRFLGEKRIFEALEEIAKGQTIFADDADAYVLYGSCQVELRAFGKAMDAFAKADELVPNAPGIRFNISEVYFVSKEWAKADAIYEELLKDGAAKGNILGKQLLRLVEFKSLLCKIKLEKLEEAEVLSKKYDFLDDSPYYFYANAAMAYSKKDTLKAEEWLARARKVYRAPGLLETWQDTLIEFGYIEAFYGGDATPAAEN
jgi:tetratricopeptide (TPR) repeat protein